MCERDVHMEKVRESLSVRGKPECCAKKWNIETQERRTIVGTARLTGGR